jgi:TetR/AcrR family transcriptional repressor of nem operon
MGHSQASKARTHQRIVEVASRKLRESGLNGIGVADLMKEAGVTAGGFYKHFASRDELVREAVLAACGTWARQVKEGHEQGKPVTFEQLRDEYLDEQHRDDAANGCPFAAFGCDLSRADPQTRNVATTQLEESLNVLASLLGSSEDPVAQDNAKVAYATMIGAVTLARLVDDEEMSSAILRAARDGLARLLPGTES